MSNDLTSTIELRVRKSYLINGIFCAIAFAVIGTVSVLPPALNIGGLFPHPIRAAVIFGVFWGAWFVGSLYLIAASYRGKLTVSSQSITLEGVFSARSTAISEITTVKWRAWPIGGSIVIRYPNSRIKIYFDNFLSNEREQLVARLRELISENCQENWEVFISKQRPVPVHPRKSRTTAILCMATFFIVAGVLIYYWHIQFGRRFLISGMVCGLVGLSYLYRILKFVPNAESESTA
ncbi:MAG: hypothetical protein R3C17_08740 [Planctomycetaceae bacterium]